jgi:hypothetical protein
MRDESGRCTEFSEKVWNVLVEGTAIGVRAMLERRFLSVDVGRIPSALCPLVFDVNARGSRDSSLIGIRNALSQVASNLLDEVAPPSSRNPTARVHVAIQNPQNPPEE